MLAIDVVVEDVYNVFLFIPFKLLVAFLDAFFFWLVFTVCFFAVLFSYFVYVLMKSLVIIG